uniref:PAP_RNA-bind domain-containing protein n=1 Tax=Caenorhabditis tropicalis TaxID=1561998 RepID=A0A1I7T4M5_9PELO
MSVIKEEIWEALEICRDISEGKAKWKALFEEVNFFSRYKHFIALIMAAPNEEEELNYGGFLESRIRLLVQSLERNQDILIAHNDPNKHKPSPNAKFDVSPENKRITVWFIGLEFAEHAKNLDLTNEIQRFKTNVELQASGVKGIGPNCQVQIDMFYVKRNNLIQVISAADLRRGRRWKRSTIIPPNNTVSSATRQAVARTNSNSVPTTPTALVPTAPSMSSPAVPNEADSTTSNGSPVSSRKRVIAEATSTTEVVIAATLNETPPEKKIRDDTLEEPVMEMIVEVANGVSEQRSEVVQEISNMAGKELMNTSNGLEASEQKMEVPQSV